MVRRRRRPASAHKTAVQAGELRGLPLRFQEELPSTVQAIQRAVRRVLEVAAEMGCGRSERQDLEIAVREALANAVLHGNRSDPDKTILLRCNCDPRRGMRLTVKDQGEGFDPASIPDPRDGERICLPHGRGIFLMRELMDHVEHREGGREVVLCKQRPSAAERRSRGKP